MMIDVNAWLGNYPFQKYRVDTVDKLDAELESGGISRAYVSSIDSIFLGDPDQGNMALLARIKGRRRLRPAVIINPVMGNWRELLGKYADLGVRLARLCPNYHGYRLVSSRGMGLLEEIGKRGLLPVVQVRVEDERTHHARCRVPGVKTADIAECALKLGGMPVIACCGYFDEVVSLVRRTKNVYADISMVERLDTVASLLKEVPAGRVLFGSHTPFLYTRAAVSKVAAPGITEGNRNKIRAGNISKIL
jgi:hypothetical protein